MLIGEHLLSIKKTIIGNPDLVSIERDAIQFGWPGEVSGHFKVPADERASEDIPQGFVVPFTVCQLAHHRDGVLSPNSTSSYNIWHPVQYVNRLGWIKIQPTIVIIKCIAVANNELFVVIVINKNEWYSFI